MARLSSASKVSVAVPVNEAEPKVVVIDAVTLPETTPASLVKVPSVISTVVPSIDNEPVTLAVQFSVSV